MLRQTRATGILPVKGHRQRAARDHGPDARATMTAAALLAVTLLAAAGCESEAGDGVRVLRLGHIYGPAAPTHACGAVEMAKRINEAAVGLDVRVHPAAQLGHEADLLEQVATGQLEMSIAGPSFLATWHEPIGVFDAAYAFRDTDHMMRVMEGEIGRELWEQLRERRGVRVLGTWPYGARHLTGRRPVREPADLADFRLRMPGARTWQETGRALGARPVSIDFAEVYLALQQGLADGQENPLPTIDAMGFHEVQTYVMLTGHVESSTQTLINDALWDRLTEEQQQAVEEAVREAARTVRQCIEDGEQRLLEEWAETGALQVIEDVDIEAFRQRAHDYFADGFVFSDIYQRIMEME